MRTLPLALSLLLALGACRTTMHSVVDADPAMRTPMWTAMSTLEGRWEGEGPDGMQLVHVVDVTSNGSVVREIMFPGTEHEMTNMYSLDGNALQMTHYCAAGNQPRMRATGIEAGPNGTTIVFETAGVSDLKTPDEVYMGAMTLVVVDDETIEQHWTAFKAGEVDHEAVMKLHRAR